MLKQQIKPKGEEMILMRISRSNHDYLANICRFGMSLNDSLDHVIKLAKKYNFEREIVV